MEEVEAANRAAVESCHRVLDLISQTHRDQLKLYNKNIMIETGEAISKFRKVVSLLSSGVGHARVKKVKSAKKSLLGASLVPNGADLPALDLNLAASSSRTSVHEEQQAPSTNSQLLHQQFNSHKLQLQLQQKLQAGMYGGTSSGISIKFENSSCTATGSSARSSFVSSSLSVDGSVARLDGGNGFQLVGMSRSSETGTQKLPVRRRCYGRGEDGNGKCSSSGRCHCSRRRKLRMKKTIKVPAISNRIADIPPDDYSWRKYGQKPIKGSPHPRGITSAAA